MPGSHLADMREPGHDGRQGRAHAVLQCKLLKQQQKMAMQLVANGG